jgi:hypothetical protein
MCGVRAREGLRGSPLGPRGNDCVSDSCNMGMREVSIVRAEFGIISAGALDVQLWLVVTDLFAGEGQPGDPRNS